MRILNIIGNHWLALFIGAVLVGGAATGLSLLPQQLYESEVDVLIVQANANTDSYTAQKSAEKLGNSLAQVVYSFDFLDRVIATGYVSEESFPSDSKQRQKQWENVTKVNVVPESSLLKIYGYGVNAGLAEDVALGVAQVLTTNAKDYHGAGDTVQIKLISGPITSSRPVKPNIPLNGVAGTALGFIIVLSFYVLREESKQVDLEHEALRYQLVAGNGDGGVNNGPQNERPTVVTPEYRVLDEFPNEPFNFGSTLEDSEDDGVAGNDEPTSMNDHLRS